MSRIGYSSMGWITSLGLDETHFCKELHFVDRLKYLCMGLLNDISVGWMKHLFVGGLNPFSVGRIDYLSKG